MQDVIDHWSGKFAGELGWKSCSASSTTAATAATITYLNDINLHQICRPYGCSVFTAYFKLFYSCLLVLQATSGHTQVLLAVLKLHNREHPKPLLQGARAAVASERLIIFILANLLKHPIHVNFGLRPNSQNYVAYSNFDKEEPSLILSITVTSLPSHTTRDRCSLAIALTA